MPIKYLFLVVALLTISCQGRRSSCIEYAIPVSELAEKPLNCFSPARADVGEKIAKCVCPK